MTKVEVFQEGECSLLDPLRFTTLHRDHLNSEMPLVWTYMYTTAQSEDLDPDFQASDFKAPMAGFGYGLPLARLVRFLRKERENDSA